MSFYFLSMRVVWVFSCLLLRFFSLVFCSYYSDVSSCRSAYTYNLLGICYIEPVALFPFVLESSQPSSLRVSTTYHLSRGSPGPRAVTRVALPQRGPRARLCLARFSCLCSISPARPSSC